MSRQMKQHSQQFKQDAVKYVQEHPDLTLVECAKNLGIGLSTLSRWRQQCADNGGAIPTRGSGNYASDEAKEIARLKRKLRSPMASCPLTAFRLLPPRQPWKAMRSWLT